MGNILAFISRHFRFVFFIFLEIICFSMVVNFNKNQGAIFYQTTGEWSGSVDALFNEVKTYFQLQQVNDSLQAENARLRARLISSRLFDTIRRKEVKDTTFRQRFTYIPCQVINNSVAYRNNYITLNAGSLDGVQKDLGVITTAGIAGVVRKVSPHFSSVMSVLHKDFDVSAEISEIKETGTLKWDGADPERAILTGIPLHLLIKKGMHIVVSRYSDFFPEGTPIGVIESFTVRQAESFYTIHVKLSTDMRNLHSVYIVNNLVKEEMDSLKVKPEKE